MDRNWKPFRPIDDHDIARAGRGPYPYCRKGPRSQYFAAADCHVYSISRRHGAQTLIDIRFVLDPAAPDVLLPDCSPAQNQFAAIRPQPLPATNGAVHGKELP